MPPSAASATDAPPTEAATPRWLVGLNDEQRAAVMHGDGPLLIVAGAGSGKTRTLAARVARLIADGTPPERILLLTFTRRAAREMLTRAAGLTGDERATKAWGGTFHAVGNRLLRRYGRAVGLREGFTVLDQGDAADLFGVIRSELGYGTGTVRFPRKDTLAACYSMTVNRHQPLDEVLRRWYPWIREHREAIADVFRLYTRRKREHNVVDYDDLLLYWHALGRHDEFGRVIADRFDHVLVDEYQDTNRIQADILYDLTEEHGNVTAVGDDAQSIYSFRAATIDNIDEFPERWPTTTIVTLDRNYRSTPAILASSNAVMDAADRRFEKTLWSDRPDGPRPTLVTCADETAQSTWVCDRILALREQGIDLREQAVLFRAGHHADALELELASRDIPFVKYGGLKFLEAAHIKDALACLRVLDNPGDVLAWHRVLQLLEGVGPATAGAIIVNLGADDPTAADGALLRFLHEPLDVPGAAAAGIDALRRTIAACREASANGDGPGVELDRIRDLFAEVFPLRYADADARLADLEQLAALAERHASRTGFLSDLTLDPPNATGDLAQPPHLDDDYLVLSTIHSAKGAEWRAVYVIHAADGNIPSDMATTDPDGVEEERRLLYVAMTRAKDHLAVTFPLRYHHRRYGLDDDHNYAQLSRFLAAIRRNFDEATAGETRERTVDELLELDPVVGALDDLWA